MNNILTFLLFSFISISASAESEKFKDFFATKITSGISLGDWKLSEDTASCISKPDLTKEKKQYSRSVLKWPLSKEYKDCEVEMDFKVSEECDSMHLAFNGKEGHVMRFYIFKFDPKAKENSRYGVTRFDLFDKDAATKKKKCDILKPTTIPRLEKIKGKWINLKMTMKGNTAILKINDSITKIEHIAFESGKNKIHFGFTKGIMKVKNFRISSFD